MNIDQIAARFSRIPGYTLIDYASAGLPLWIINFDALVIAAKNVALVDEFILRTISSGVATPTEISGFLGLDSNYVERRLGALMASGWIVRLSEAVVENAVTLGLTLTGRKAIDEAAKTSPRPERLSILYDGITRQTVTTIADNRLIKPMQLRMWGLYEVPATPSRNPNEEELNKIDFTAALPKAQRKTLKIRQVIAVTKYGQMNRRYREAIILVYKAIHGDDLTVRFATPDGRPLPEHDSAFVGLGGVKRLNIREQLDEFRKHRIDDISKSSERDVISRAAIKAQRSSEEGATALQAEAALADKISAKEELAAITEGKDRVRVDIEIAKLTNERNEWMRKANSLSARRLEVWEHTGVLEDALRTAKTRILLVSPWISDAIMGRDKLGWIEDLLRKGVDVFVGYGITDRPEDDPKTRGGRVAVETLGRLARTYPKLRFRRLGDTHAKILAKDREYSVAGSFNWMSFGGFDHGRRRFREEVSYMIREAKEVDGMFERFQERFEIPPQGNAVSE